MDPLTKAAFFDELAKIAGVGWDLHGYKQAPLSLEEQTKMEEIQDKDFDRLVKTKHPGFKPPKAPEPGKKEPGFFGRLFGAEAKIIPVTEQQKREHQRSLADYTRNLTKYKKEVAAFAKAHPLDPYEVNQSRKIKTPFDKQTAYKLNDQIAASSPNGVLWQYTTDQAYSDKPVVRDLTKKDLRKVVKIYQETAKEYLKAVKPEWREDYRASTDAFVRKAKHLLKDPNFVVARLEYE